MSRMRFSERLKPIARRRSSASPPVKFASTMAMRRSCSWKSGTPIVRSEDRLQRRVRVGDGLAAGAAVEVRVDHLPHDRAGPDDRDLDHEVVEDLGLEARQRRHLRAALHLEEPDRVRLLQHAVDLRVVHGQVREVDLDPAALEERERVLERRHHAEAEQVHLHDPEVGAVLLVPLHDHAVRHGRGLERHHAVEGTLRDHHAARVLAEVARQVLDLLEEPREELDARVVPRRSAPRRGAGRACRRRRRTRSGAGSGPGGRSRPPGCASALPISREALRSR